jgi:hypothetical protein
MTHGQERMSLSWIALAGWSCAICLGCASTTPGSAAAPADPCAAVQTPDQRHDQATLQRIELAWLTAELRGNTQFLECLLLPDYVNIGKDGQTHPRAEVLGRVAKNVGKDREIPPIESTAVVHGDAATAYSRSRTHDKDGQSRDVAYIDTFVFVNGAWHAYSGVDL